MSEPVNLAVPGGAEPIVAQCVKNVVSPPLDNLNQVTKMVGMNAPLDPTFVKRAIEDVNEDLLKVEERIYNILEDICAVFNKTFIAYWFGADEEAEGCSAEHLKGEYIETLTVDARSGTSPDIIDKFGNILNLFDKFPIRWISEDYHDELVLGAEKYRSKKRKSDKSRQEKKAILMTSIKSKLTSEEHNLIQSFK